MQAGRGSAGARALDGASPRTHFTNGGTGICLSARIAACPEVVLAAIGQRAGCVTTHGRRVSASWPPPPPLGIAVDQAIEQTLGRALERLPRRVEPVLARTAQPHGGYDIRFGLSAAGLTGRRVARVQAERAASDRACGRSWTVRRRRVQRVRLGCRCRGRAAPAGAWPDSASA